MPYEKQMTEKEIFNQEMNKKAEEFLFADMNLFTSSNLREAAFLERQKEIFIENPAREDEMEGNGFTKGYVEKIKKLTLQSLIDEEQAKLQKEKRKESIEKIKNKIKGLTDIFESLFKKPLR